MKGIMNKALKKTILKRVCLKYDVPCDLIDLEAVCDSQMHTSEELRALTDQYIQPLMKDKARDEYAKDKLDLKGEVERIERERNRIEQEFAEEEFEQALEGIVSNASSEVDKYYLTTDDYIEMVGAGYENALIITSAGGMGKTYRTLMKLKKMGAKFHYKSGYTTPLAFYKYLWRNNEPDTTIVLDDFDAIFKSPQGVANLKQALWAPTKERIIEWDTTSDKAKDVPSKFKFQARVIFLMNKLPDNADVSAVITRALFHKIHFKFPTLIQLMFEIAKQPSGKHTKKERLTIMQFIRNNANPSVKDLNIRTLFKAYDCYAYAKAEGKDWHRLVKEMLEPDETVAYVIELESQELKVGDRVAKFVRNGFGSRATYYRVKQELKRRGVLK